MYSTFVYSFTTPGVVVWYWYRRGISFSQITHVFLKNIVPCFIGGTYGPI